MPKISSTQKIALALHGGGSHTAFSWGAVDQLLLDEHIEIEAISATSGGAVIASVLAQGLHDGGRDNARALLQTFWKKVSVAASMLPLRVNVVDKFFSHAGIDMSASSMALDYITKVFSPSQFNLFDINPVRGILEEMVDFDMLQAESPVRLYINATHARTGESVIFDNSNISLDAVMAAACLPFIFKTAEVNGEPYWDGSFSGCPSLAPLIKDKQVSDIVLVKVHQSRIDDVPTTATDILDRAMELSFGSIMQLEIQNLELQNRLIQAGKSDRKPITLHTIEAQDMLQSLGRASKLNAEWNFLVHVHDMGVQAASDWLDQFHKNQSSVKEVG
ncbi:MAG: patatin-like phospholipase family protein [Alphaproteobacteria bacterium]